MSGNAETGIKIYTNLVLMPVRSVLTEKAKQLYAYRILTEKRGCFKTVKRMGTA